MIIQRIIVSLQTTVDVSSNSSLDVHNHSWHSWSRPSSFYRKGLHHFEPAVERISPTNEDRCLDLWPEFQVIWFDQFFVHRLSSLFRCLSIAQRTNLGQCSSLSGLSFRDQFIVERRSDLAVLSYGSCSTTLEILVAFITQRDPPARRSLQRNSTSPSVVSHDLATENSRSLNASWKQGETQRFLLALVKQNHCRWIRSRSTRQFRSSLFSPSWSFAGLVVSVLGHCEYFSRDGRWRSSGSSLWTVSESRMAIRSADVRGRKLSLGYSTFDQTTTVVDGQTRSVDTSCSALWW